MYTRCPSCSSTFRVTAAVLQMADGDVRCGSCDEVFNALRTLVDDWDVGDTSASGTPGAGPDAGADGEKLPPEALEFDVPETEWQRFFISAAEAPLKAGRDEPQLGQDFAELGDAPVNDDAPASPGATELPSSTLGPTPGSTPPTEPASGSRPLPLILGPPAANELPPRPSVEEETADTDTWKAFLREAEPDETSEAGDLRQSDSKHAAKHAAPAEIEDDLSEHDPMLHRLPELADLPELPGEDDEEEDDEPLFVVGDEEPPLLAGIHTGRQPAGTETSAAGAADDDDELDADDDDDDIFATDIEPYIDAGLDDELDEEEIGDDTREQIALREPTGESAPVFYAHDVAKSDAARDVELDEEAIGLKDEPDGGELAQRADREAELLPATVLDWGPPPSFPERAPRAPAHTARWLGLSVAMALLLGAQYLHSRRDELGADPSWGSAVRAVYAQLGMPLHPDWPLAAYEIRGAKAIAENSAPGALDIVAEIAVSGPHGVGLPMVRVVLRDRWSNAVASGIFAATDYLAETPPPTGIYAPGTLIPVQISLKDPGAAAQGYELDVCVPNREVGLQCKSARDPFRR